MNKAEYFTQHALDWMVNVREKMCRTEGCGTQASFGVAGTKTAEYIVPAPSETCWFRGMSVGGSFRRV